MVLSSVNIFGNKDSICRKTHLLGVSRHKPAQTSCHLGRLHVTETCYVCPAVFISAFAGRSFHPSWPYIREIGRRPLFLLQSSIVHCIVLTSEAAQGETLIFYDTKTTLTNRLECCLTVIAKVFNSFSAVSYLR